MATTSTPAARQAPTRTQLDVFLGKAEKPLGRLIFVKDGQRAFSQFAYSDGWLTDAKFFDVPPDSIVSPIRLLAHRLQSDHVRTSTLHNGRWR